MMDIFNKLSSQANDRSGNYQVAAICMKDQSLVAKIAEGLSNTNNKIVIDCTEVLTEIAKEQPAWVAPYATLLPPLLNNKNNRARWESMHCISLIAEYSPATVEEMLDLLREIVDTDKSVIVRDYAIDAVANYAKTGKEAARTAYPFLQHAAKVWQRRHAKQTIGGLQHVLASLPEQKENIRAIAEENLAHEKGSVRTAAKKLLRTIEKL